MGYREITITEETLKTLLQEAGYEGLVAEGHECGCLLKDDTFRACESDDLTGCLPGYMESQPPDSEYAWLVCPGKRPTKEAETEVAGEDICEQCWDSGK